MPAILQGFLSSTRDTHRQNGAKKAALNDGTLLEETKNEGIAKAIPSVRAGLSNPDRPKNKRVLLHPEFI